MAAWVEGAGGWVNRVKEGCREPLPKGVLPVSASSSLPLDPDLATLLLTGMLPPGARELPELPGWVEADHRERSSGGRESKVPSRTAPGCW